MPDLTLTMNRIARERPKIDRIARPWLIKRFIDPDAHIFYVSFDQVQIQVVELDATPFHMPDTEFTIMKTAALSISFWKGMN